LPNSRTTETVRDSSHLCMAETDDR
jgi:hypothetical protein